MTIVGTPRRGSLKVFKNPADAEAPYRAELRLPDGRHYQGRLRSHPCRHDGGFWYEGFVTAEHAAVYAQDQQLVRYPAMPALAPARWDLLPCQIKINPYPSARAHEVSPEPIGQVWVSRADGTAGGELFSIHGRHHHRGGRVIAGDVVPYRRARSTRVAASSLTQRQAIAA
jgi:hypothetical protein